MSDNFDMSALERELHEECAHCMAYKERIEDLKMCLKNLNGIVRKLASYELDKPRRMELAKAADDLAAKFGCGSSILRTEEE